MAAVGELSLNTLLASLAPELDPETFVFVTIPSPPIPGQLNLKMMFEEKEGLTLIAAKSSVEEHELPYQFPCRMITLNVHSSLEAVGFMAVVADRLRQLGMGVNPVSGYYHDHLFVPEGRETEAMDALRQLAEEAKEGTPVAV
ncbi:hypothetical protein K490DRAFT_35477 [Saccharata proteae CBS 121410]|uniref:DUF2241 domain-containing protein n=1 Tax=Saccharata proteae CBS 121410 TaxID=1314787 RepID=A0A9P4HY55_9PEZI|nr:hypothetical protein K490DRAFT_35477 [Saccharata proteae CBS 121410]